MQMKHLIIFALISMALLLGFNVVNGKRHESNRAMTAGTDTLADINNTDIASGSNEINNQPLGEQPKAIMNNATIQIDSAQQIENERLQQMDDAQ